MPTFIAATFDKPTLTVDYVADDGSHLLRRGGTIAWRFNNPGNIRPAKSNVSLRIGTGKTASGEFCIFASYEIGRRAKKELLRRKYDKYTISEALEIYAPRSENDTDAYIDHIIKKAGLPHDKPLSSFTDAQLDSMMDAMESKEGFNAKTDTRKEKWVHTTRLTLSDGASPIIGEEVKVKIDGKEYTTKTKAHGAIPPIVHVSENSPVEIFLKTLEGQWKSIYSFVTGKASRQLLATRDQQKFQGTARMKARESSPKGGKDQSPLVYVVKSGDNLTKIAKKFKATVADLRRHNQGIIKGDLIFPGQSINIYGIAGAPSTTLASPPAKPAPKPKKVQPTTPVLSSKGQPLALIDPTQRQAPWMEVAIREAKRQAGKAEVSIDINYHQETGASFLKSMEGTSNAWCASFVNWCLESSSYAKWKNSFRARAILKDANFAQIEEPVYGSIVLIGTHHVCFLFGFVDGVKGHGTRPICLGGNQSDQINFTVFGSDVRYFVPRTYLPFAKNEISQGAKLGKYDVRQLNESHGIVVKGKKSNALR